MNSKFLWLMFFSYSHSAMLCQIGKTLLDNIKAFEFFVKMAPLKAYIFSCFGNIAFVLFEFGVEVFPFKNPFGFLELKSTAW